MSLYKGNNLISGVIPNSANQSLSNLDSAGQDKFDTKVNKAGDTMTGDLTIKKSRAHFQAQNTDIKRGQTPLADYYGDTYMLADIDGANIGSLSQIYLANGKHATRLWQRGANSDVYSVLDVGMTENDVPYCSFPNTTCCDGQYVNMNPATTIANQVSINGSSALTYTLNLPNDNRLYMVWLMVEADTGAASGDYINVKLGSDIMTSTTLTRAKTKTTSTIPAGSTACIAVGSSHKIYLGRATNWNGTVNLLMIGYRRIGTNA